MVDGRFCYKILCNKIPLGYTNSVNKILVSWNYQVCSGIQSINKNKHIKNYNQLNK